MKKKLFILLFLVLCLLPDAHSQVPDSTAWALIEGFEQSRPEKSPYFKHLNTEKFIDNIKRRLIAPQKFCQGFGAQFCGPSALIANNLIATNPVGYVQLLLDFYRQGEAVYFNGRDSIRLAPNERTRSFVGRILDGELIPESRIREWKGDEFVANSELLSENEADQMIILCLKYRYPGVFGRGTFQKGDATKKLGFGSTMFKQFMLIAGEFFALDYTAKGASMHDCLPSPEKVWPVITGACATEKTVYLMVDGPYFRNNSEFVLWGSHFIRLHAIHDRGDKIDLEIWDYGYRRWIHDYKKSRFFDALTGYLIVE